MIIIIIDFFADFSVDFRNINFMPYRFRPLAKVRPKRDVRRKEITAIDECRRKKKLSLLPYSNIRLIHISK